MLSLLHVRVSCRVRLAVAWSFLTLFPVLHDMDSWRLRTRLLMFVKLQRSTARDIRQQLSGEGCACNPSRTDQRKPCAIFPFKVPLTRCSIVQDVTMRCIKNV